MLDDEVRDGLSDENVPGKVPETVEKTVEKADLINKR
jgi:hypothetical protein